MLYSIHKTGKYLVGRQEMKILSFTTLITMIFCTMSYAIDQYVYEANKKVEAMDKAKPCDYYRLEPKQKNESYVTKATLYDKFKNKLEIEGEILDFRGCIDVDGDSVPEAVVTDYIRFGGGAPIYVKKIYKSSESKIELIGKFVGEFGEDAAFVDLNKDGKTEIVEYNMWSGWGELALNDSPTLLEISCFRKNEFVDCTKEFTVLLNNEIDQTLKEVREYKKELGFGDEYKSFMKSHALKYLALYRKLGQEQKGWDGVKKYFPDAYAWLKNEWVDEKDFRCFKSIGLKKPLRLQFSFQPYESGEGYVTYQNGSGFIHITKVTEKEAKKIPSDGPSEIEAIWQEDIAEGSGGKYIIKSQGTRVRELKYIRKKDGKIFNFEADLEAEASGKNGCAWNKK
jgi:hypothetical protein